MVVKVASTTESMEQRKRLLTKHAVVIMDEGPLAVQSREEVKDIIMHHFGIMKHVFYVYRSFPEPFVAVFLESHDRDVVFAAGRAIDGPIELGFHDWDIDRFGDREIIPYYARLYIKGILHHAWSREVVEKVLCNEALIHHVEEETLDRSDQRVFKCWDFSRDPSRIPQVVLLALAEYELEPVRNDLVHFNRPRETKKGHVFKVLIHIDAVEDLMFYHHPREELLADGKVPWKDFVWQLGWEDEEQLHPPTRGCDRELQLWRRPMDDDEGDRDQKRPRARSFFGRVSN
jgi:hypothetical protein